ncbi:hypothetical protein [Paludisphaera soli]|uniref:hypothetical protein n=1 Tax=Paludisphaera soli TaxID=2712865 RepID=UPI0013EB5A63|nr:hypothetical protein [Paludisphaera soli]
MTTPEINPITEKQAIEGQCVMLDNANYEICAFTKCEIVYRGGAMSTVKWRFKECDFYFGEAAGLTVLFLRGLYNMDGDGGTKQMVENLLRGPHDPPRYHPLYPRWRLGYGRDRL